MTALPRRERIVFLAPNVPRIPGGGARVYYEHASGLARRGYSVCVLHSRNYRPGLRGLPDRGKGWLRDIRHGTLRTMAPWMPLDPAVELRAVDDLYRTPPPPADVLVSTYWQTGEYLGTHLGEPGPLAGTGPRPAVPVQLMQSYEVWAGPRERVEAVWRLPFEMAVVSRDLRAHARRLGAPDELVHVVPNGLDHRLFRVTAPISDREPRIGLLAHPAPVKGLADAVEALRLIRGARPDVPVLAFGSGRRPADLPEWVDYVRKPVGERLVRDVYNRCTVFLCASHAEGWGFPSAEAMACGAALVSTRNGGIEDFAVDGESAALVPVRDPAALAEATTALLDDDAERARIVDGGLAAVAGLSWTASTDAFEAVIRRALERAGG